MDARQVLKDGIAGRRGGGGELERKLNEWRAAVEECPREFKHGENDVPCTVSRTSSAVGAQSGRLWSILSAPVIADSGRRLASV